MRLYLAVAVLLLALVAYTEAQDDTLEGRLNRARDAMTEWGRFIAERAKTAVTDISNSEFVVNSKNIINDLVEKGKARFQEATN